MPESLSFGDALFLYLERPEAPLHVASICLFEGEITLESCIEHIESKLPQIPRYWQRVIPAPFGIGFPFWQHDEQFDIRNHVREAKLRRGTEAELRQVASGILSHPLDRRKPLWDFTVITGLRSGRTAILARVHHCLADGISGIGLLNAIMDSSPTPPKKVAAVPPESRQAVHDPASLLIHGIVTSWFSGLERILNVESQLLQMAQALAATASSNTSGPPSPDTVLNATANGLTELLAEFGSATERLPFNIVCQGPQKFDWTELPFSDIHTIKKQCGTTVNDVVLMLIASTLRKYARARKIQTKNRVLRIVVPVNMRAGENVNGLGNQITFLPVTVPLDIEEPRKLLAAVHERVELLKKIRLAEMVGMAGTLLGTTPTVFQIFLGAFLTKLPISLCNTICTNVPGPTNPLYLMGHKMEAIYPYVPIGGEMGMNCAIVTYDGKAFFGFTGDATAIPDLKVLPKFVQESFRELQKAVLPPQRRVLKPRRPRTVAPVSFVPQVEERKQSEEKSPTAMAVGA